jgi:neutral ceramidase
MKVGAAKVDITPPLGMQLEGFEVRVDGASGIHDPLHARALVAEGADGTTVALVVADLIQIDARLQGLVADEVREKTGIPRERLQLAGTHTHSGPRLLEPSEADGASTRGCWSHPRLLEPSEAERTIGHAIAGAVARAWEDRREAVAAVGIGRVEGIGASRRPNGGPVDDRVTVTRFDGVDGRPIATHASYGCHPTTLGPNNLLYSADFPGVLCRLVDEAVGGVTIFSTGPQGDVNPGGYSPEGSMVGVVVPWRTFESAERYGRILADCVLAVRDGLAPVPSGRVWGDSQVVELRRKRLPDLAVARAAATTARASERAVREADLTADATYHALVAAAYAELIADQAADPDRDGPVRVRASALAFGPLLHVGVQGELFVGLGQQIRAALGDETTCVAALCDGTVGYIPTADAFSVGGYEPNASVLQSGEGERLVEAVVALASAAPLG